MYIEKVHLRDWKSYVDSTYEFPRPTRNKNVVLIGAQNGYGKTSLLEALMLCLYGREGLAHIPRATLIDGDQQKLDLSYDEFLRRAFHGCALDAGRNSSSVTVTLNDDGQRTTIARKWYFAGNGRHRPPDEEVRIYQDDEPFKVGRLEDRPEAISNFIAKTFVPVYLAPFFLFDGEQVQRLANKEMAMQVRTGIEGLLGVGILRQLQEDLRDYAISRKQGQAKDGDNTLDVLQDELRNLTTEHRRAQKELQEAEPKIPGLRQSRESKLRQLNSIAGGNSASIKELYEEKSRADARRLQHKEKLIDLLHSELALSIAGNRLRIATADRLQGEEKREAWENGKAQGQPRLEKFKTMVLMPETQPEQAFSDSQKSWLQARIEAAWESLWYPPPDDCADSYLHNYLAGRDRQAVIGRLGKVDGLVLGDLKNLTDGLADVEQEIRTIDGRIRELGGIEEQVKKLTNDIQQITTEEQEAISRTNELKRKLDALKAQMGSKNADLERLREQLGRSAPLLQRSERAERIASVINLLIGDMYPLKVKEVADAMTKIYKELAHKQLLARIDISDECEVVLRDKQGNDLRRFDASAGENQIFAVALISAIAQVSGAEIPMVIDTPLARLDEKHRMNVLEHLASQRGQVILLSATDEVTGPYLRAIEGRVAAEFHLQFEELESGIGVSRIAPGYFGRTNDRRSIASSI
jgi:DNA sulfur modification protein DndD